MNNLEHKMVDVLKDLHENHAVNGIKAEFEAEGTRLEEALRLKEVVSKAGLGLTIKIGGGEALRDMYECRTIGVERVVAPMIESAYALKKFLQATRLAFPVDERDDIKFAVNVETITSCKNFDEMLMVKEIDCLDGIIMGRVDLTGSLGMSREDINCPEVFEITKELFLKSKSKGLENALGGGVSAQSLPFIRQLPPGMIDRYETRKVIFQCPEALGPSADKGILKAVGFELLWLKNKRGYYQLISQEDDQRLDMLERRYKSLIELAGGQYE
ncbi:MAG: aldolase/citrate lyase family protein [Anaerolineaceae bacterium]|nr:aldolase/citrate lyase family protein [Anaerolineaceae bacterium]